MSQTAFVFPGQGSQEPGMGAPWAHTPSWTLVDRASRVSGRDVAELLLHADADTLRRTDNAQLATFVLACVAHAEVRAALPDVRPVAVAGHSLGEYTALVASGALGYEDGVRLVAARGEAMREACAAAPGTMGVVLGLDVDEVRALADRLRVREGADVWVANLNSPQQAVLSGAPEGVARCGEAALAEGATRVVDIPVGGAFHSPLMEPARPRLAEALAGTAFRPAHAPVVANVDGRAHDDPDRWPDLMLDQLTSPVLWLDTVRTLTGDLGADLLVELGPGRVLTGFAKRITRGAARASVAVPDQIPALAEAVGATSEDEAPARVRVASGVAP
ncbi:ACP S-malonyltransferase [Nocardiopsis sp. NPDC049922]|uniref:ACP S-malonyltransferase n=1 Tax=Nocardiopsis sp. NPDC049922 TaxID=3155157 RepID=UPI0033C5058F